MGGALKLNPELNHRIKAIAERLKKNYHAQKVILYGSFARGEATADSDIDLLIVAPTNERFFERMATVRAIIRDLRNGLPIAPIVLTPEEVKEKIAKGDQFVKGILEEGVIL